MTNFAPPELAYVLLVPVALLLWGYLGAALFRRYLESPWMARPYLEVLLVALCGPMCWYRFARYLLHRPK